MFDNWELLRYNTTATWSDFPHLEPFGFHPRLSDHVAVVLYRSSTQLSNILKNLFERGILKKIH